jgi:hypothetical protein
MKSILDPSFRYTKSFDTDLRKTFIRIRRAQQRQQSTPQDQPSPKVVPIGPRTRAAGS